MPVGRVEWQLPSAPVAFGARLCIHAAEFSATVRLEQGELVVVGYLHATENLVALEVEASGLALPEPQPRAQCLDEPSRKTYREAWKYPEPDYGERGADRCAIQVYGRDEQYGVQVAQMKRRVWSKGSETSWGKSAVLLVLLLVKSGAITCGRLWGSLLKRVVCI